MKVKFTGTSPDGEPLRGFIDNVPESLTDQQLRWLVYGRLVDRNTERPFGYDPNDCLLDISLGDLNT
jgi:hypothetical protein